MRAVTQLIGLAAAGALFAGAVEAQTPPKLEFGIDLGIASSKLDEVDDRILTIGLPVDARIGFVTASPWMIETRFGFNYVDTDLVTATSFTPGVNVLWRLGAGTGLANQMGPYITGGASLNYSKQRFFDEESESTTQLGVIVGIGTRLGWGNAAFRPELFFQKGFESGELGDGDFVPAMTTSSSISAGCGPSSNTARAASPLARHLTV